jgi:hypothetical protein
MRETSLQMKFSSRSHALLARFSIRKNKPTKELSENIFFDVPKEKIFATKRDSTFGIFNLLQQLYTPYYFNQKTRFVLKNTISVYLNTNSKHLLQFAITFLSRHKSTSCPLLKDLIYYSSASMNVK